MLDIYSKTNFINYAMFEMDFVIRGLRMSLKTRGQYGGIVSSILLRVNM